MAGWHACRSGVSGEGPSHHAARGESKECATNIRMGMRGGGDSVCLAVHASALHGQTLQGCHAPHVCIVNLSLPSRPAGTDTAFQGPDCSGAQRQRQDHMLCAVHAEQVWGRCVNGGGCSGYGRGAVCRGGAGEGGGLMPCAVCMCPMPHPPPPFPTPPRVDPRLNKPQALCMCPTRELVVQNLNVLNRMAKYTGIRVSEG